MAGQPKRRALELELKRRAVEDLEREDATPFEYVIYRVASGTMVTELARELGVGKSLMWHWIGQQKGPNNEDGAAVLARARTEAAHAIAEDSVTCADDATDRETAAVARAKSAALQWLASKWNRAMYGQDQKGASIQVNVGSLHLEALRAAPVVRALPAGPISGPTDVDVEYLTS